MHAVLRCYPMALELEYPIDGFHSRDLVAILVYKTIQNVFMEYA